MLFRSYLVTPRFCGSTRHYETAAGVDNFELLDNCFYYAPEPWTEHSSVNLGLLDQWLRSWMLYVRVSLDHSVAKGHEAGMIRNIDLSLQRFLLLYEQSPQKSDLHCAKDSIHYDVL